MNVWSFLGSEPSNGSGSLSLGFEMEGWDWTSLSIAVTNLHLQDSLLQLEFHQEFCHPWDQHVWIWVAWMGVQIGADDMGTGVGGCDRVQVPGVVFLEKSKMV